MNNIDPTSSSLSSSLTTSSSSITTGFSVLASSYNETEGYSTADGDPKPKKILEQKSKKNTHKNSLSDNLSVKEGVAISSQSFKPSKAHIFDAIFRNDIDFLKTYAPDFKLDLITRKDQTPLKYAIERANIDAIKTLVASGANPNFCPYEGFSPLTFAVDRGNCDVVVALIEAGANPDQPDTNDGEWRPIDRALLNNNIEMVRTLLKYDINKNNALKQAEFYKNEEAIKLIQASLLLIK